MKIHSTVRPLFVSLLFGGVVLWGFASCSSVPSEVNPEWNEAMFFKNAQEALDANQLKAALYYYEVYMIRYPENFARCIAAQYERANIYYKMRKYDQARRELEEILRRYQEDPYAALYPDRFEQLCYICMENIEQHRYVDNHLFWRFRAEKWAEDHGEELTDQSAEE